MSLTGFNKLQRLALTTVVSLLAGCGTTPTSLSVVKVGKTSKAAAAVTTTQAAKTQTAAAALPVLTPAQRLNTGAATVKPASGVIVHYAPGATPAANAVPLAVGGGYRIPVDPSQLDALKAKLAADPAIASVETDVRVHAFGTITDPYYSQQWELPKIQADKAMDIATGSGVTVASVDSGVMDRHPDLAGQVTRGWDFIDNDADPTDMNGHGTHTAGSIAALMNNNEGVAGVAPGAHVLAVRALDANGEGDVSAIADGINYAVQHGAKVINLSLGTSEDVSQLRIAVAQAVAAGVVVVAAAGNDGVSTPEYPAAYPGVIAVGATDQNDARCSFSNYGSWVTLAAPGSDILSTYGVGDQYGYAFMDGTSMAAPHVAAAAALLLSKTPGLTADQIKQTLVSSGDAATGFSGSPNMKRLNVFKALGAPAASPSPSPSVAPSAVASVAPTPTPSHFSTPWPTPTPGQYHFSTPWPTPTPVALPSVAAATPSPAVASTPAPSPLATVAPTAAPTASPTVRPSVTPSPSATPVLATPAPVIATPSPDAFSIQNLQATVHSQGNGYYWIGFSWTTPVAANMQVEITNLSGFSTPVYSAMLTSHSTTIAGFKAGTVTYRVRSTDGQGRTAVLDNQTISVH